MNSLTTHRIAERFAQLSVEQRRAVYEKIRLEGLVIGQFPILVRNESLKAVCMASYAQIRQWFLWQLEPASTAYHISGALKLRGELDVEALKASFDALVARHESLRTVFGAGDDGQVRQIIQAQALAQFETVDLISEPAEQREALLEKTAVRLHQTPFNLETGPLLRVGLIRQAADEHVLVVVMHHIISDGWSMQIIVDEFVAQYSARVQGLTPELAALPIQYADYGVWQRNWLEAGEQERQLAYWKNQLGDEHPILQLPTDHPRQVEGRYRAARHSLELPAVLVQGLHKRAQTENATLFMALLTGVQTLLHRYSSQHDIRVGVPIANRERVETEGVVGFFVNTQVLSNVVNGRLSLTQALEQAKAAMLGAQAHQDLPFEQLVEALQPERNLGTHPLFQVLVNHQRQDLRALQQLPGLSLEDYVLGEQSAQFELTIDTSEDADGRVQVSLTYAKELFEPTTIERMTQHYVANLQALVDQPQQTLGDIELLKDAERAQLQALGENPTRYPHSRPVHRLIEDQVGERGDATAVVFAGDSLTYTELNRRANQLAHHLINLGVQPEVKVGIAVERSLDMVIGLLGILKAGGAYVPLDPELPTERLAYMVRDSGIKLLLTQSTVSDRLSSTSSLQVLALDAVDLSAESAQNPDVILHGENLAYAIYTSGSTGKPKGVMVRHGALSHFMLDMQQRPGMTAQDVIVAVTPLSFDIAALELYLPLISGARMVLAPKDVARDGEALGRLINESHGTLLQATPASWRMLRDSGWSAEHLGFKGLCGGEALTADLAQDLLGNGVELWNMYGPTETTIWSSVSEAKLGQNIGQAIADTGLYVLDASLNMVPAGVAGELCIGGVGLARGYLNQAALSAERFVASPFASAGERLYRTGDLVRWNHEGQLEYLGRIDHQVKIRGFRIELGEVEAKLLAQPEVTAAVVVAKEGPSGARLVGYVVAQAIDSPTLRERLSQTLPDYMVPGVVVVLESLPLNANGKVDRKALPEPEFESERVYEAPRGADEETLAAIWVAVLGVERVGRHDNFFELGGDSILSLKVVARARANGLGLTPRHLFEHQSLAAAAKAGGGQSAVIETIPVLTKRDDVVPSYAQARQWFLWQLEPASTAYHISGALKLRGELDVEALKASFDALVARHESLRTVFSAGDDGQVRQIIQAQALAQFETVDLISEPAEQREALLEKTAVRLHQTPFNLETGPLLRVGLIRQAADEHVLVVVMHHIISDGWSMQIIVDEFVAQYSARVQDQTPELEPLPIQYADYGVWQRHWLEAGEKERQLNYWKTHLGDEHPVLQLPTDHLRRADGRYVAARHSLELPTALVQGLQQRSHVEEATLFIVLLAGIHALLHRYSGQQDVRVGVPIANRNRIETESIIGFFVNTQVLRSALHGGMTLSEVLEQTKTAVLGAQTHQDLPFEQLVEALQPERTLGINPLFQVLVNHQRQDLRALQQLPGLSLEDYVLGEQSARS